MDTLRDAIENIPSFVVSLFVLLINLAVGFGFLSALNATAGETSVFTSLNLQPEFFYLCLLVGVLVVACAVMLISKIVLSVSVNGYVLAASLLIQTIGFALLLALSLFGQVESVTNKDHTSEEFLGGFESDNGIVRVDDEYSVYSEVIVPEYQAQVQIATNSDGKISEINYCVLRSYASGTGDDADKEELSADLVTKAFDRLSDKARYNSELYANEAMASYKPLISEEAAGVFNGDGKERLEHSSGNDWVWQKDSVVEAENGSYSVFETIWLYSDESISYFITIAAIEGDLENKDAI